MVSPPCEDLFLLGLGHAACRMCSSISLPIRPHFPPRAVTYVNPAISPNIISNITSCLVSHRRLRKLALSMSMPARSAQSASLWCSLPGDVFNTILQQLPPAHRCLLPQVCSAWQLQVSSSSSNANYWRNLSLCQWGPALLQLAPPALRSHASAAHEAAAWRRYYIQRVAWFELPISPHHFIQEDQCGDPWRIMVACQVSSRTGASLAKRDVLNNVLSAYPTPSAMLSAPKDTLAAMMDRVGMQEVRAVALKRMSEGFLGDWQLPSQLFGIGPFGQESVFLFQRGASAWPAFRTNDTSLRVYLSWARKDLQTLRGSGRAGDSREAQVDATSGDRELAETQTAALHSAAQAHLMTLLCPSHMRAQCKGGAAVDERCPDRSGDIKRPAARGGPSANGPAKRTRRAVADAPDGVVSSVRECRQLRGHSSPCCPPKSCQA